MFEETEVPGEIHRLCHIMKGTGNVRAGTIDTWCSWNEGLFFLRQMNLLSAVQGDEKEAFDRLMTIIYYMFNTRRTR